MINEKKVRPLFHLKCIHIYDAECKWQTSYHPSFAIEYCTMENCQRIIEDWLSSQIWQLYTRSYFKYITCQLNNAQTKFLDIGAYFIMLVKNKDFYIQIYMDWTRVEELYQRYQKAQIQGCLLYTSPSPRDLSTSRMPSSA